LEAMACGTPIIVSDLPGIRALVADSKNGLIIKRASPEGALYSLETLRQTLAKIMDHPENARKMGQAALQIVTKKYAWATVGQQLCDVFTNIRSSR
ncbi:MAG: glycosyltransferase family 4 protein, partial [Lentisphaerae bacterium]|nr:glycosyltransferase family 4 protein [Lentisphaerota bacterium]